MEEIEITRLRNEYAAAADEYFRLAKLEEETSYPVITNGGVYTHRDHEFHSKVLAAKQKYEQLDKEYFSALSNRNAELTRNTREQESARLAGERRERERKEELERKKRSFSYAKERWKNKNILYKLFHYKMRPYNIKYRSKPVEEINNLYR